MQGFYQVSPSSTTFDESPLCFTVFYRVWPSFFRFLGLYKGSLHVEEKNFPRLIDSGNERTPPMCDEKKQRKRTFHDLDVDYFYAEMMSRAVKLLKGEYCARAIREHRMERAIIFCRTKMDCDNLEAFFNALGSPHAMDSFYSSSFHLVSFCGGCRIRVAEKDLKRRRSCLPSFT